MPKSKIKSYHSTIGKVKIIPKEQTQHQFSAKDIFRPLLFLVVFSIFFFFFFSGYGLIISILLTTFTEIAGYKQNEGLIELEENGEVLPMLSVGFWGKVYSAITHIFGFLVIVDIIIIIGLLLG